MNKTLPTPNSQRLAYGIKDLQRQLGISRSSLYRAISRGELKTVKVGSRTLILATALDAFLANRPMHGGRL